MIASALELPPVPELPPVLGGGGGRLCLNNADSTVSTLSSLLAVPPQLTSASNDAPTTPPIIHFHPDRLMDPKPFSFRPFTFVTRRERTRGRCGYQLDLQADEQSRINPHRRRTAVLNRLRRGAGEVEILSVGRHRDVDARAGQQDHLRREVQPRLEAQRSHPGRVRRPLPERPHLQ